MRKLSSIICLFLVCYFVPNSILGQPCSSAGRQSFVKRSCNVKVDTVNIPNPTQFTCNAFEVVDTITPILPFQAVPGAPTSGNACDSACFSKIIRTWNIKVENSLGTFLRNEVYKDSVGFTKIALFPTEGMDTVACPRDTIIYCPISGIVDTSIAALGSPLGSSSVLCNILQSSPISTLWQYSSKGCYKITRSWNLLQWCPPVQTKTCFQTIEIRDTIAPMITPIPGIPDQNFSGDVCFANFILPSIVATDNCSLASELKYTVSVGGASINTNGGLITNIPGGIHDVVYTVDDGCGNTSMFKTSVIVVDKIPPIALCKGPKVIAIPASGMAVLPKYAFDDGSFDRCSNPVSIKVKRMNDFPKCTTANNPFNHFGDDVKFCCSDAGTEVMIILRVYQHDIPTVLVSLDATYPIYSDCMTSVKVIDKVGPTITCPMDTTIDCRDIKAKRVKSLTAYGSANISDMCLDSIWIDSIPSLDECLKGSIIRKINAKDKAGNISSCSQTIHVTNLDPFDASDTADLLWPKDTTFFICSANTHPSVTGYPIIKDNSCAKIAFNLEDETYSLAPGACKKILRKWSLTDWCQVNPLVKGSGRWHYTQKIVVMDTAKPVLTVPANIIANNNTENCGPIAVTIALPSATDCTPEGSLIWSYTTDLDSDGLNIIPSIGKNASQSLPNGIHKILFTVNDGCGNSTSKSITVTVRDTKKPSPAVIHGLATDLARMDGAGMVRAFARQFFLPGSATDNCTPFSKLKFSFSANVNDTVRNYTCDSVGTRNVRLFLTDEANNQDWVNTYILIQNNMNSCTGPAPINGDNPPALRTAAVEGQMLTETGKFIDQVSVKIMNGNAAIPDPQIIEGKYTAGNLALGKSYEIIPKKDINPTNGVSTVDLILMQKHILGVKNISSPYKIIAADIDKNQEINTNDLLELRKLILGIDTRFTKNESWRFVDAAYKFTEGDPLQEPFVETYKINEMERSMKINFIGVKIGDVNESSIPNNLQFLESRNTEIANLLLNDATVKANSIIHLPIQSAGLHSIGHQLAFSFTNLEVLEIIPGTYEKQEIASHLNGQVLKISAVKKNTDVSVFDENATWYTLVLRAKTNLVLSKSMAIVQNDWITEQYDNNLNAQHLVLKWNTSENKFKMLQNVPNPFTQQTTINYYLPQAGKVGLRITDLNGRIIYAYTTQGIRGHNTWLIDKNKLPSAGIYYYRIESNYGADANKMIWIQ